MSRPSTTNGTAIDWEDARRFLLRAMSQIAGPGDSYIEDLVQEACVRLLRAQRRGAVTDPEALMRAVAHRTWVDHVRRHTRARAHTERFGREAGAEVPALEDPALGDLIDRIELVMQEIFEQARADECKELALEYFAARDWRTISERRGVSYAAVRKRWSRCIARVREAFAGHPDFADLVGGGE